ncbi:hypothetical protein [Acetivibrio mesophilus]|jgi:hypothetical protein|uniref:Uncharacterized protein n=1 Tax=Acetivibrio mesophilus TaxID=2487273 RepID=A0A4Q0I7K4_9FIRM|nr:hypothetical protein [Acetivibrio mesophilus]RXE60393.1 hypothetical protein EFD62_00170 [Acetivibrio mesophilus]
MKTNRSESKHVKKPVLAAAMIIGASTMMFQGFTQVAASAEFNKTNTIPTSYVSYMDQSSGTAKNSLPEGYKEANYTIRNIDLEYYRNQTPTSKDMAKKDAAEIGAQALWSVYSLSLEGQVVEMGYQPATDDIPRSRWYADVLVDGERSYSFEVDSVTGDLFAVTYSRTLDKNVSVAYDAELAKNPQEYAALAKETAEKLNVVHGAVASVEYNCQGYRNNDPDITFNIKGENGEVASMTFSRYDKALLAVSYNAGYQYTLKTIERIEQKVKNMDASQMQKSVPSASGNQAPFLTITSGN